MELLRVEAAGEHRGVRVIGELDASTAEILAGALREPLRQDGDLLLDVSELSFVDSAGIRLILVTCEALEGRGTVILRSPSGMVRRVIELTGIDKVPNLRVEADSASD